MPRTRAETIPTLPLFDPGPPRPRTSGERTRAQRPVGWGRCPTCTAERTAVIRTASHLVWREHRYTTYSGAKLVCQASLAPLCSAPDRSGETDCHHPAMSTPE